MPSGSTPGASTRKSTDFKMPVTKSGTLDKRYVRPQMCKKDGTRDMRTKLTQKWDLNQKNQKKPKPKCVQNICTHFG